MIIHQHEGMNNRRVDTRKIKLVIWDLDETFWAGTLSENNQDNGIDCPKENIELVKRLSQRGIVNSICSKNDKKDVEEQLQELGVLDYFVFASINWEPKGVRVKNIITQMALRAENVLFIDDNFSNLAEVERYNEGIMVSDPSVISLLCQDIDKMGKKDTELSRLNQYKVLEVKYEDAQHFSSNEEFLRESGIKICIKKDVRDVFDRVYELILRTNQLNFTKKRLTKEEFERLSCDTTYDMGYVLVVDNYGEYGIVGFYAMKDGGLEHFLFSCRTMGMGIEQYVFQYLGRPRINIVPPVSSELLENQMETDFIQLVDDLIENREKNDTNVKILFKGPCDLQVVASYLEYDGVIVDKEFNFLDKKGNQADYYNHSLNVLNSIELSEEQRGYLFQTYGFLSEEAFDSHVFSGAYDVICFSPLMDATLAVYQNINQGYMIPYGLFSMPITKEENWSNYIDKKVMTARSAFVEEELRKFSMEYEEVEYPSYKVADNIEHIITLCAQKNKKTKYVILLLSELEYENAPSGFEGKEKKHKEINDRLKERFSTNTNVYLLDVNKYIRKQSDYFDNINHYSKLVYYNIAKELAEEITKESKIKMVTKSKLKAILDNLKRTIYKILYVNKRR